MPMKTLPSHPAPNPLKRPRQEPVSCQFCRTKKLRCNRHVPCSNCSARGLPCDARPTAYTDNASATLEAQSDVPELSVLARLKRLEDIVIGRTPEVKSIEISSEAAQTYDQLQRPCLGRGHSAAASVVDRTPESEQPALRSADSSNVYTKPTTSCSVADLSTTSEYREAIHILEDTPIRQTLTPPSRGLKIRVMSTHEISVNQYHGFDQTAAAYTCAADTCLPNKIEATLLYDHYCQHVDPLQHVLHLPTVHVSLDTLYADLENGNRVTPSDVVLLLAIFASASALCVHLPGSTCSFFSSSDAGRASAYWTNAAVDVLEFTRRTAAREVADVQAGVILGFLLFHGEGFSTRARCLFASSSAMARDLGLHKTDLPNPRAPTSFDPQAVVEREIKRRLWWHVVATDWLLSLTGGPQHGTYFIQPRHMRVNLPLNIDDEQLMMEHVVEKPVSEPTVMSYYLQRIKFATICRGVVDVMPLADLVLDSVKYEDIIELDNKFEAFFRELPVFFKVDEHHIREAEPLMQQHPHMQIQRYTLNLLALTARYKLHQPFLIRHAIRRQYDYSRQVSLSSARSVLRLKKLLHLDDRGDFVAVSANHTGVLFHVFMATVVLVMDLCFNKAVDEAEDTRRKAEVVEACKMLEEAKAQSSMASDFLDSLMNVLRKHQVHLYNHQSTPAPKETVTQPSKKARSDTTRNAQGGEGGPGCIPDVLSHGSEPQQSMYDFDMTDQEISQHYLSDFDNIWQEYIELGPNMDMPGWDSLFSELDERM